MKLNYQVLLIIIKKFIIKGIFKTMDSKLYIKELISEDINPILHSINKL